MLLSLSKLITFIARSVSLLSYTVCIVLVLSCTYLASTHAAASPGSLFTNNSFTKDDAILVVADGEGTLFERNAHQPLVIASLTKLITADLSIAKWGVDHHFYTDFYLHGETLIVKGYGDPYLISEELTLVAAGLKPKLRGRITKIEIDGSFFRLKQVPGRSQVSDPYNAPISAVSANFNTAMLRKVAGGFESAEAQTPLTATAERVASQSPGQFGTKSERVNLQNQHNAQTNFAEILAKKLSLKNIQIKTVDSIPVAAELLYRHTNTRDLGEILLGSLMYSNNFIANQLYLMMAAQPQQSAISFPQAAIANWAMLQKRYGWQVGVYEEGSGLSRSNRYSADQVMQVLDKLSPYQSLLKKYSVNVPSGTPHTVDVHAKSGTLNGVHTFAGYFSTQARKIKFVFLFNRKMPYKYREGLMSQLVNQIASQTGGL